MSQSVVKPFSPDETAGGAREWETIILRMIGKAYTVTLVKVGAVEEGATGPVGFLTATDLLQQADGNNEGIPNVPMHKMPYFRLQGGANAVIIDPKPGDIGLAAFARRDITEVKRNPVEGVPPSLRQFDPSDGLYIGGLLNGAPSQYIHFMDSGINIVATGTVNTTTPSEFVVNASKVVLNAPVETSDTIKAAADITDNAASQSASMASMRATYNSHTHAENDSGGPTDPPNQPM